MESAKAAAIRMIERMPDEYTWDQIAYRVWARSQIEKGLAEIDAGLGIPNEQVVKETDEWLKSFGPQPPAAAFDPSTVGSPEARS